MEIGGSNIKLIKYHGKLNSHKEYLDMLELLEAKCERIEYVLVDEADTRLIERFRDLVISVEQKNNWWGTISDGNSWRGSKAYTLGTSKELFQYLRGFETFCKYIFSVHGDCVEETDFGINDIAFFDKNEMPLLFTTTHEGYIKVRSDLLV